MQRTLKNQQAESNQLYLKNGPEISTGPLTKEDTDATWAYALYKICSTSYVIGEMQTVIKGDHFTPIRMAKIQNTSPNAGEVVDQQEFSYTVCGNLKWYSHFGSLFGIF